MVQPEHGAILAMEEREKEKVKAEAKRIKERKEKERAGAGSESKKSGAKNETAVESCAGCFQSVRPSEGCW
jgi:hypothetical protein